MSEEAANQGGEGTSAETAEVKTAASGVVDSSTTTPETSGADGAAKAGAGADSSTEHGKEAKQQGAEKKPATPLEAVTERYNAIRKASEKVEGKEAPKTTESPPADTGKKDTDKPEAKAPDGKKEDLLGLIDQDEWNRIPGKTRKRIEQFRSAIKERDAALERVTPAAKAYEGIAQYCTANKVTPENFRYVLGLTAALQSDPERAWRSLQPIIAHLRQQVGEELPPEIAARVEKGELSTEAARELVRTQGEAERSRRALAERQAGDERARRESELAAQAERQHGEVMTHLGEWEGRWKSSDPDYSKKMPHVWKRMQPELRALMASGKPATVEAVTEIAAQARKDVEELMREAAPAARQVATVTGGGTSKAMPAPKTHLEAVQAAYARMRA